MKSKLLKTVTIVLSLLVIAVATMLNFSSRTPILVGEEPSPDNHFVLRIYEFRRVFGLKWSMPGDDACEARLLRLYASDETVLQAISSDSCALQNATTWTQDAVILPDGETVWTLPAF